MLVLDVPLDGGFGLSYHWFAFDVGFGRYFWPRFRIRVKITERQKIAEANVYIR